MIVRERRVSVYVPSDHVCVFYLLYMLLHIALGQVMPIAYA
jgi:hypothetical protein